MGDPQTIEGARAELAAQQEYKTKFCHSSATRQMADRRIRHLIQLIATMSARQ